MLAGCLLEVGSPSLGEHGVSPASVVFSFGSFDEACPFEAVNKSARATVRQDAFSCERLDSQPAVILSGKPKQYLVLGVAEACCSPQVLLKLLRQSRMSRKKTAPRSGLVITKEAIHQSEAGRLTDCRQPSAATCLRKVW